MRYNIFDCKSSGDSIHESSKKIQFIFRMVQMV